MAREGVLHSLDRARTQMYHFMAILIAGMGFFTDAYDLFCISGVTALLGRLYYFTPPPDGDMSKLKPGKLPINVNAAVASVALCGTFAGQLFFGWAGDQFGRKAVYGFTLVIMVLCSIGQALSFGSTATSIITTLCFFRFWLGFGVGGDYPLSACIMSEYANTKTRGAFISAVFAQQGTGILAASAMNLLMSGTFNLGFPSPPFVEDPIGSTVPQADWAWRTVVGFGAIPALATYYYRMKMPETARFTALVARDARQAAEDMGKVLEAEFTEEDVEVEIAAEDFGLFSAEFARRHGVHLAGCCLTWFFLDVAFYSQNLFQKDLFIAVGWSPPPKQQNALEEMWSGSRASALIALCSTVPGYWVTVFTIDYIGRKTIQFQGFFFMTLFMGILAGLYPQLRGSACPDNPSDMTCGGNHTLFVILYALTFFFANFGPNTTTFVIPAELFPARLRTTCHGISAAMGKAGAIVGSFGFLYAAQSPDPALVDKGYSTGIGVQMSLILLTITNAFGFFFTFMVPETSQKSLEELSGERMEGQEALESNGKHEESQV